jgi:hypothetical protein
MFLGRLALATGWSGNLDYMTKENSLLVDYRLIPVGSGEYPFGENQMWAEADVGHAAQLLDAAIADPTRTRAIAAEGRRDIRLGHGYRAVGLRILDRVTEIVRTAFANPNLGAQEAGLGPALSDDFVPDEAREVQEKVAEKKAVDQEIETTVQA